MVALNSGRFLVSPLSISIILYRNCLLLLLILQVAYKEKLLFLHIEETITTLNLEANEEVSSLNLLH